MPKRKSPIEGGSLKKPSLEENGRPKVYTPWDEALIARFPEDKSPRYLVATRTDGDDFKLVKSIVFAEEIEGKYGDLNGIQKLRNGQLLLHTVNKKQTDALLNCSQFGNIPVKIETHGTLNEVRGVIFHRDLILNTDDELMRDLKKRGVTKLRRITRKVGDKRVDTGAFVLHFEGNVIPKMVKVTSYKCDVKPYIPPPMRCYQCQKFGHVSSRCVNKAVCSECGKECHEGEKCTPPPMCTNCQGFHSPRSKDCPEYKKEAKIQEIRTLDKLSYREARKKFRDMNAPEFRVSFAAASASNISPSSFIPSAQPSISKPNVLKKKLVPVPAPAVSPKKVPGPSSASKPKAPVRTPTPVQSGKVSSPTKHAKKPSPTRSGKMSSPARTGTTSSPSDIDNQTAEKRETVRRRLSRPPPGGAATPSAGENAPATNCGAAPALPAPVGGDICQTPRPDKPPDIPPPGEDMEVDPPPPPSDGDGWQLAISTKKKDKKKLDSPKS